LNFQTDERKAERNFGLAPCLKMRLQKRLEIIGNPRRSDEYLDGVVIGRLRISENPDNLDDLSIAKIAKSAKVRMLILQSYR
jgi:hypothetical protein